MTFSIILTSIDRKEELKRFVSSINEQEKFDLHSLQIIFVDQGANEEIFKLLDSRIETKYIQYHKCSLSEARNLALPYVKNDIICFGDDDAWYDNNTFEIIDSFLQKGYDGVFGIVENENNVHANVFPSQAQRISYTNHCGAMSASMFIKFDSELKFDENIGVGSPYNLGSGEETDYLFSYMEKHHDFSFFFTPEIIVRHPAVRPSANESYFAKNYSYARGFGYVLRKHSKLPLFFKFKQFIRPLGGIIIFLFSNRLKAKKSFFLLKGRIEGFFYNIKGSGKHTI